MIPSTREILSAIYGAWSLFKLDPKGLEFFEDSVPAFWRSFFAAVIVAPGYAIMRLLELMDAEIGAGLFEVALVELIAYVVIWTAFPLALYYLCRGIDREERFVLAVVALNWSVVIQIAISLPVHVIVAGGILTPGLAAVAMIAILGITLFYAGFVARSALDVTPLMAAWVVGIDVAISILVQSLTAGMLR